MKTRDHFEQRIREQLGEPHYRILINRLIGAQRAMATLMEIAPELFEREERDVPQDMQHFLAALLDRFDVDELEPPPVRDFQVVKVKREVF